VDQPPTQEADFLAMSEYITEDKKGRKKLAKGYFSPSRLKTLEACPWQYELKYNRKIYPYERIIEPHSELGSAMHYFAEHYDGSGDPRKISLLTHNAKNKFTLEEAQLEELDVMIDNLVNGIWPLLEGKGEREFSFTPKKIQTEVNIKGEIMVPSSDKQFRVMPLNMKIDRLVTTEDNRHIIIDFKKGQPNTHRHLFQVLFYAVAYSQRFRVLIPDIEIWLIFPNEKKNWIRIIDGAQVLEHVQDFEEDLKEKFDLIEQKAPFTEEDAQPSFLCNFCPFHATDLCPTTKMLEGAKYPENAERKFYIGSYVKGRQVKTPVNPEKQLNTPSW